MATYTPDRILSGSSNDGAEIIVKGYLKTTDQIAVMNGQRCYTGLLVEDEDVERTGWLVVKCSDS